jgi:glutamine---fructose-6-phosphate transaminase (isomerizing)
MTLVEFAPGNPRPRALTVAAAAADQGRQVVTVAPDDDEIASHARFILPVHDTVREEFSPLHYHVFAGYLASYSATQLGRLPFQA